MRVGRFDCAAISQHQRKQHNYGPRAVIYAIDHHHIDQVLLGNFPSRPDGGIAETLGAVLADRVAVPGCNICSPAVTLSSAYATPISGTQTASHDSPSRALCNLL